jgi:hypothetical protein
MKYRSILLAAFGTILIVAVFSVTLKAQAFGQTYVKGTVTVSGRPFVSAWVVISQNGQEKRRFLTGDDGKYYIGKISPGVYDITVLEGVVQRFNAQINLPRDRVYDIRV